MTSKTTHDKEVVQALRKTVSNFVNRCAGPEIPYDSRTYEQKLSALNRKIRGALREFYNDDLLTMPGKGVPMNKTHKLDWDTVHVGINALIGALNLRGGPDCIWSLHRLLTGYFSDCDLRREIDELVDFRFRIPDF